MVEHKSFSGGVLLPVGVQQASSAGLADLDPILVAFTRLIVDRQWPDIAGSIPWPMMSAWTQILELMLAGGSLVVQSLPQGPKITYERKTKLVIKVGGAAKESSRHVVDPKNAPKELIIRLTKLEITLPWWPKDKAGSRAEALGLLAHEYVHIFMYYLQLGNCLERKATRKNLGDQKLFNQMVEKCEKEALKTWGSSSHNNPNSLGEGLATVIGDAVKDLVAAIESLGGR